MDSKQDPQILQGLGVSPGVAIGRAVCLSIHHLEVYRIPIPAADVEAEVARFRDATQQTRIELEATRKRAHEQLGDGLAGIFEAQSMLLEDASFVNRVEERIRAEQVNAEWAVHKVSEEFLDRFENLESEHLRERGDDLRDVTRHLLRVLQGIAHHELSELGSDVIIVAHDLTPSEAVRLGRQHVVAFAIETGGPTSHTSIIARDLNIPLVTGLDGVTDLVTDDDPAIVDGTDGTVILHPLKGQLAEYAGRRKRQGEQEQRLLETGPLPCVSRDGVAIELMANIDLPEELEDASRFGAAGLGLYRSEFLYIERAPELPTEDDHVSTYRRLLDSMSPHPVLIRTFDLGGRKLAREVMATDEENPVLGLRGIRLTLARPHIFKTQLRGLFRAGVGRNLWIMLPMVSARDEILAFRAFAAEVMAELEGEGIEFSRDFKLGIMIEVPAAAMISDILAQEVDFFSIGTNDLIQYSLAVDRNNEHVSYLYRPLHPAILRMIRFVLDCARDSGVEVSMCGEMAGDQRYTALLLGMGLRRLSVSPRSIPEIKSQIRGLEVRGLAEATERCLTMRSAAEVERCLDSYLARQETLT
ncbi:MAG: phosphoenolpyruvate--protein phosphotransferase [Thermoanaerobaculia bacterium]